MRRNTSKPGFETCKQCARPFLRANHWETMCIPCWKTETGKKLLRSDRDYQRLQQAIVDGATVDTVPPQQGFGALALEYQRTLDALEATKRSCQRLEREKTSLGGQLSLAHDRLAELERAAHELEAEIEQLRRRAPGKSFNGSISRRDLKTLRRLCHPDKHNGDRAATEIAKLLNQLIASCV